MLLYLFFQNWFVHCQLKLLPASQAAEECTSVLELDYNHTGALMLRAQTLVTLKEYNSALFDVNRLIELNPSSEVYQNLQARLKTQLVDPHISILLRSFLSISIWRIEETSVKIYGRLLFIYSFIFQCTEEWKLILVEIIVYVSFYCQWQINSFFCLRKVTCSNTWIRSRVRRRRRRGRRDKSGRAIWNWGRRGKKWRKRRCSCSSHKNGQQRRAGSQSA